MNTPDTPTLPIAVPAPHPDDIEYVQALVRQSLLGGLAQQRDQLGLSQTEVGERAGLSRMSVQRAEAPDADIQLSTFVALALAVRLVPQLRASQPLPGIPLDLRKDWKQLTHKVWAVLRQHDHTLPDHALDAMRDILEAAGVDQSAMPVSELVHRGLAHGRTRNALNRREAVLAQAWEQVNQPSTVLPPVVEHLVPGCSQEQATAMATAVQWLGSEVGFDFLERALDAAGFEIKAKSAARRR
jgi:DNA-binding XRE family transcriptional regulator